LSQCLTVNAKFNYKFIKDLNVRSETLKLPEENIGNKGKKGQVGLNQTKKVLHGKVNNQYSEEIAMKHEKMLSKHTYDQGIISKIYEELQKLISKTNTPKLKMDKESE
jgi:hypothetical protein